MGTHYTVKIPMDMREDIEFIEHDSHWTPSLEELKEGIGGGLIERVTMVPFDVWVDEEGLLKGMGYNVRASHLVRHTLVGDAYVTGNSDPEGRALTHDEVFDLCSRLGVPMPKEQMS